MSSCDLHLHSHYSDGTWSPSRLINHAIEIGLSTVSLTDHDSVNGLSEAQLASGKNIDLINGVEVSCKYEGNIEKQNLHLLGYFICPECPNLQRVLDYNKNVRLNFAKQLVSLLNSKGIPLTMESISRIAGKGTIGASHMTKAIISCGVSGDITEVYNRYFGKNKEINIDRSWISINEAIEAIKSAGGIAVLAHPGFDNSTKELLFELNKIGLSGVEVFHSYHSKADQEALLALAKKLDLVITGGSDCHGPYEDSAPYMGAMNLDRAAIEEFLAIGQN